MLGKHFSLWLQVPAQLFILLAALGVTNVVCGQAVKQDSAKQAASGGSSGAINSSLNGRILKNASFKKSFESLFIGQKNLDPWLVQLIKRGDGVQALGTSCSIGNRAYEYYSACEPHNCGANHIHVLFEPNGLSAWALFVNRDSGVIRFFGKPDPKLRSALEVIDSWIGQWPKPACVF